jgi:4-amino-4-deoxy-L-arabinose transferase-like glycosyltransferase
MPALANKRGSHLFWASLLLLAFLAFAIRLYKLDQVPAGLFYDEAYEGLDAYSLFGKPFWQWPLFYTAINGREPLFVYLVHAAQRIWGPATFSVRIVSATAGALLTPALSWLAWELSTYLGMRNRYRFVLWAGMTSLALLWPQTISRLGQRISLFALLEVLTFAALWHAWHSRGNETTKYREGNQPFTPSPLGLVTRHKWWLLTGLLAGLTFYTYLAVRLLPFILVPVAVVLVLRHRQDVWERRWQLLVALSAALAIAAPLLIHFIRFPEHFNMRTGQVNILVQGGLPALLANMSAVFGMAFVRGDFNLRLNYPDRPVLDFLTVLPFLVGLAMAVRWLWRPASLFLVSGLGIMLVPTLISEEAPNFGRSFGALPFVVLLIALGLDQIVAWLSRRFSGLDGLFVAASWLLLLAAATLTIRVYFVDWASHPDSFAAWDTGYTALTYEIRRSITGGVSHIYAGPGVAENPTVEYLLADQDESLYPRRFDGNVCLRLATKQTAHYYVLSALSPRSVALLDSYLPQSIATVAVRDGQNAEWARRIVQPANGSVNFPEMIPYPVDLSDGLHLLGYWLSRATLTPGETYYVRLFWEINETPAHGYIAFVQLLHRDGRYNWQYLAGVDRPPGGGSCPTTEWRADEVVIDEFQFDVPLELPPGDIYLAVGLYHPSNGQRLIVTGNPDNVVLLGTLAR